MDNLTITVVEDREKQTCELSCTCTWSAIVSLVDQEVTLRIHSLVHGDTPIMLEFI